jgi:hypothetical protein
MTLGILEIVTGITSIIGFTSLAIYLISLKKESDKKIQPMLDVFNGVVQVHDTTIQKFMKKFGKNSTEETKLEALKLILERARVADETKNNLLEQVSADHLLVYTGLHHKSHLKQLRTRVIGICSIAVILCIFTYVSNSGDGEEAAFTFNTYRTQFQEVYFDMQVALDEKIIIPKKDDIRKITLDDYSKLIIDGLTKNVDASAKIKKLAEFYRSILACEEQQRLGCNRSVINSEFGAAIHNFWFAYAPFLKHLRKDGHPDIAKTIENKAILLKQLKRSKQS